MKSSGLIVMGIVMALALSGCAQGLTETGSISPIKAQADDFNVTVAQGIAVGAVAGGLITALAGGDTKKIMQNAAIGGLAGGIGGYAIAGQKREFANREDALNAVADDCAMRNQKLAGLIATTDGVLAERERELSRLKTSQSSDAQRLAERQSLVSKLNADKAAIDGAVEAARKHGDQLRGNIDQLKQQFPDDRIQNVEKAAGEFSVKQSQLEQKSGTILRMINDTSEIKVES